MGRSELMPEMLKLGLLRQALQGELNTHDQFVVKAEFDVGMGVLRFVSRPGVEPESVDTALPAAMEGAKLERVEWDHSAVGKTVQLANSQVEIAIGLDGVEQFGAVAKLARTDPSIVDGLIPKPAERAAAPTMHVG